MVKVDLLGKDFKKAKEKPYLSIDIKKFSQQIFFVSIIFFIGGIIIWGNIFYRKGILQNIIKKQQESETAVKKINELKKIKNDLEEELAFLNSHLKRVIIWSSKLEQLRRFIPKEVWLTRLSLEKRMYKDFFQNILYLRGGLIPQENTSAIGTLSNFINKLKENQDFLSELENPILTESRTETKDKTEITTFTIEIPLKVKTNEN